MVEQSRVDVIYEATTSQVSHCIRHIKSLCVGDRHIIRQLDNHVSFSFEEIDDVNRIIEGISRQSPLLKGVANYDIVFFQKKTNYSFLTKKDDLTLIKTVRPYYIRGGAMMMMYKKLDYSNDNLMVIRVSSAKQTKQAIRTYFQDSNHDNKEESKCISHNAYCDYVTNDMDVSVYDFYAECIKVLRLGGSFFKEISRLEVVTKMAELKALTFKEKMKASAPSSTEIQPFV